VLPVERTSHLHQKVVNAVRAAGEVICLECLTYSTGPKLRAKGPKQNPAKDGPVSPEGGSPRVRYWGGGGGVCAGEGGANVPAFSTSGRLTQQRQPAIRPTTAPTSLI